VTIEREVHTGAPADLAWAALAGGAWAGPLRLRAGGADYAGTLRLVDVDEDERRVSGRAQARQTGGWGGLSAAFEVRPAGDGAAGALAIAAGGALAIAADPRLSGEAGGDVAEALVDELAARLVHAAEELLPSPADDPAFRRRLAARAALAVAVGAAVGLAGAAWGRRRG
jgi:carbon monoxide dehydrogenase subunit G